MHLDEISNHFNIPNRVEQDLINYGIKESSSENFSQDPFEKLRENLILEEIKARLPAKSLILDVGSGIGNMVKELLSLDYDAHGIDISEGMVITAKNNLRNANHNENRITQRNFLDKDYSFNPCQGIILNGVIWYYSDEIKKEILRKLYSLLVPGGFIFIVHRNVFFNIFALNQGTVDFFKEYFFSGLQSGITETIQNKIKSEISGLIRPVKNNGTLAKPYDNPLTIASTYREVGFHVNEILYTYIHPAPPRFEIKFDALDYEKAQAQYVKDWQGMFLGSQFIVIAEK